MGFGVCAEPALVLALQHDVGPAGLFVWVVHGPQVHVALDRALVPRANWAAESSTATKPAQVNEGDRYLSVTIISVTFFITALDRVWSTRLTDSELQSKKMFALAPKSKD